MRPGGWEVGICGTFDVENYGDLLFPLIAEAELADRLGHVHLHRYSYRAKTKPDWPYDVTSVAALPDEIQRLDALLIGGGFLVRFDKEVAPGYGPPTPAIHHPTGYWLTPALLALQHDVPLIWNGPSMHCNDIPAWAAPLLERAMTLSRYVSVRDEPTRAALSTLTETPIAVIPDTAFGLARLVNVEGPPSAQFERLAAAYLNRPYIVVQATLGVEGFVRFVRNHPEHFAPFQLVALPVGPILGERHEIVDVDLPGVIRLAEWPAPLLLAELVGRSEAVVGHSYHLLITALSFGVPAFTRQNLSTGKYTALRHFDTISALPSDGAPEPDWFISRVGRRRRSAAVQATDAALAQHWDRVAAVVRAGPSPTAPALNRVWQSLPTLLERYAQPSGDSAAAAAALASAEARAENATSRLAGAERQLIEARREAEKQLAASRRHADGELAAVRREAEEAQARLAVALRRVAALERRLAQIDNSTSWRITAPVRFVGRRLRKPFGDPE